eukprot:TRINITY_DN3411_c0_g2_i1.p1 TRINITY_DN3411_c0_g2~~TRINITY_DN3411_c0_g2_i1.p1  ORF type:complete len:778 (-),score=192.07 TRINITY_DN3411_c0_g2_i1:19-2352(-)
MTLRAVVDFNVHIESFRNIDLYSYGLYFLKFNIYYLDQAQKKISAHPYCLTEAFKTQDVNARKATRPLDSSIFSPAKIVDPTSSFYTKTFLVKLQEEEIDLNDICFFRAEIDYHPNFLATEFFLEAELLFAEVGGPNSLYGNTAAADDKPKENTITNNQVEFKTLGAFKARLYNFAKGIHEYFPIIFDEQNYSVINTMLHSVVVDYRFRYSSLHLCQIDKVRFEDIKNITKENVNLEASKNLPGDTFLKTIIHNPKSLGEFIMKYYPNDGIDVMYNRLLNNLKETYDRLFDYYNMLFSRCVLERQRKEFKKILQQPPMKLILPEFIYNENQIYEDDEAFSSTQKGPKPQQIMKLSEKLKTNDLEILGNAVLNEVNFISGQLYQLWHKFVELLKVSPRFICAYLAHEYHKRAKLRWSSPFVREVREVKEFATEYDVKMGDNHNNLATNLRNSNQLKNLGPFNVEDLNMFPKADFHPILFEHVYNRDSVENLNENSDPDYSMTNETELNNYRGLHLFVLVHGFQGNSFDMKLFKNNLSILHPDALFLCSSANEDNTEGDIGEMGERLAAEVTNFIKEICPGNALGRISFIGHSLGGLIIRAALPNLEEFSGKMYTFLTLSSPHLGYLYHSSSIIDAGIWLLKRWKKSKSLIQLSYTDEQRLEDCFLYRLGKKKGLEWFKNIALLSSYQDGYAPYDSARIEISKEAKTDATRGASYIKMVTSLLGSITANTLHRIDVNFKITEKSLDSLIGRAAHIQFLENQALIKMLIYKYEHFFYQRT